MGARKRCQVGRGQRLDGCPALMLRLVSLSVPLSMPLSGALSGALTSALSGALGLGMLGLEMLGLGAPGPGVRAAEQPLARQGAPREVEVGGRVNGWVVWVLGLLKRCGRAGKTDVFSSLDALLKRRVPGFNFVWG